jgi:hypothetical protein
MHTATYRTIVQTRDAATVDFTARHAADELTIVDSVRAVTLNAQPMTEVKVTYQALNENEANATALSIRNALSHLAPTDEGRVTV